MDIIRIPAEDYTDVLVRDSYQTVLHIGVDGRVFNGTGSLVHIPWDNISQSVALNTPSTNDIYISQSGQDVTLGDIIAERVFAQELYVGTISEVTRSILYESGSSRFGDSLDDTHQFTGSVFINGGLTAEFDVYAPRFFYDGQDTDDRYLSATASTIPTASYVEWDNIDNKVEITYNTYVLDSSNIINKYITLANSPKTPYAENVALTIRGAGNFHTGIDFSITNGNRLTWDGFSLDGLLEEGDYLTVNYAYV